MSFKVGDRVIVVKAASIYYGIGMKGTILSIGNDNQPYYIKFDNDGKYYAYLGDIELYTKLHEVLN